MHHLLPLNSTKKQHLSIFCQSYCAHIDQAHHISENQLIGMEVYNNYMFMDI